MAGRPSAPSLRRADGQAAIEWLGVLAVVAVLISVVLASGVAQTIGTRLDKAVTAVFDGGAGTSGPGSTTENPDTRVGPGGGAGPTIKSYSDLPPGPRVAPLTKANELTPWTRVGMTQTQWDQLQDQVLARVNPHGLPEILFGDKYAGINLDANGHIVLVPIDQDGIGEGLGDILEGLTGVGKALASTAAEALGEALGSISGAVLTKLAGYGLLNAAEEGSEQFATESGQAYFWSGNTNGVGVKDIADELAAGRGGTTLESLARDRGIQLPPWDFNDPDSITSWTEASRLYAQSAKGTVYTVLGESVSESSIWSQVELPALEANPAVTKIVAINPVTRAETVITP